MAYKALVFHLENDLPREVLWLLKEFRLMVNKIIRVGLETNLTSRNGLIKSTYHQFRADHRVQSQYIHSAGEVAATILKNYKRRLRKGLKTKRPFAKKMMLKLGKRSFNVDLVTGHIRISIRVGEWVSIKVNVSQYHRRYLEDKDLALGSLTICPNKVIIAIRKTEIEPYVPSTVIALDTNERSIDGVFIDEDGPLAITYKYPNIPIIQERHIERRQRLQKKKAHDRRTMRRLCQKEGRRERNRVNHRLHKVANRIVDIAKRRKSVIILEDLTGLKCTHWSKKLRRRISSWPRRKLHHIIDYQSEWDRVPVVKVDPRNSSISCPICGRICKKSRKDGMFRCECGWECPEHINASLNIFITAISSNEEVARAVRFRPDASWHDPMMSLYDLVTGARTEANRMSCISEV